MSGTAEYDAAKRSAVLMLLARLALVYWRPDFTAEQAKLMYSDYADDLAEFSFEAIEYAVRMYRRDGANKFFPTPGQLCEIANAFRTEQARARPYTDPLADTDPAERARALRCRSRPILWWYQRRELWNADWHERDIPPNASRPKALMGK